jgi:hypothetical protein
VIEVYSLLCEKYRLASYGMLRHVALVETDVSEELSASFTRVTIIGELGTTLAVTSNRCTLRRNTRFLQDPHCVTFQKTPFVMVTAVKTSNLTYKFVRKKNIENMNTTLN